MQRSTGTGEATGKTFAFNGANHVPLFTLDNNQCGTTLVQRLHQFCNVAAVNIYCEE